MASKPDTSEYAPTKAPDTRKEAEERESTVDYRLIPGGVLGSPTLQGMAGLEDVSRRGGRDTGPPDVK